MTMTRLHRFLKSRQLHTIISQETIKPSSPTPPHLKTHKLSLVDQLAPNANIPLIFFYKNYMRLGDINILKKSLSQTLTTYYPFAGRFVATPVTQIDCNDQGVEFFEASSDSQLNDLILKKELDGTINQLIPNYKLNNNPNLVEVQLNHLSCGGVAVVVSISHKIADGYTMINFMNHWATVTRGGSPKDPTFLSSKCNMTIPEITGTDTVKYAIRRFVFPNSKLNELKNKVNSSVNPTRVEILSSLIFKCAVGVATTLSGCIQPSNMYHVVNMRKKIMEKNRPEIAAGNICTIAVAKTTNSSEIKLDEVIHMLRKDIMDIKEVRDVEEVGEVVFNKPSLVGDDKRRIYGFSSVCRFPFYQVDFGWGKPEQFMLQNGVLETNVIHLMDTPSGEGIEAIVQLEAEEMSIFQNDKEILAYSQDI